MTLREKIQAAINETSSENGSDTPDYVLAAFLEDSLLAFDRAVNARERHFGRPGRRLPTIAELDAILAEKDLDKRPPGE